MINLSEVLKDLSINYRSNTTIINSTINQLSLLNVVSEHALAFIDHKRADKLQLLENAKTKHIICDFSFEGINTDKTLIFVEDPKLVFSKIGNLHFVKKWGVGIHPSVSIHPKAKIHPNVYIGANVSIGESEIGEGCVIHSNVSIYDNVIIGKNVLINSGATLGSDGYGYIKDETGFPIQFPHVGRIVIEDHVDIGANTSIDIGSLGDTSIGFGTKLDNLVHIGHNVKIGKCVYIAAMSSIAGSTRIGDHAAIWIGCSIADGLSIGENSFVGMGSVVMSDLPPNKKCFGNPARVFADNS